MGSKYMKSTPARLSITHELLSNLLLLPKGTSIVRVSHRPSHLIADLHITNPSFPQHRKRIQVEAVYRNVYDENGHAEPEFVKWHIERYYTRWERVLMRLGRSWIDFLYNIEVDCGRLWSWCDSRHIMRWAMPTIDYLPAIPFRARKKAEYNYVRRWDQNIYGQSCHSWE